MNNTIDSLSVRALCADNDRHMRQLVKLFERIYGENYPVKSVYQSQFWQSHIASRFISIACFYQGEIVAHLACQPDKHSQSILQISYTALDKSVEDMAHVIGSRLWHTVKRISRRQQWKRLYHLDIAPSPSMHFFQDVLGTYETLICPGYYTSNHNSARPTLLVSQRFLERERETELALYAPERHSSICKLLYAPLGLATKFFTDKDALPLIHQPADARAVTRTFYPNHSLTQLVIQPSLVSKDFCRSLRYDAKTSKATLLFISMRDPACPALCDELEEYGYRFSGIASGFQGRDNIVYSRCDDVEMNISHFSCERAKALATYIETYKESGPSAKLTASLAGFSHAYVPSMDS